MKATIEIYDRSNGEYLNTMVKDAEDFYDWIARAANRNAGIFAIDFQHINVSTERRFFQITIE